MSSPVAGTRMLLAASLRHDFRNFAPWIALATALSASSALVYPWIFPDQHSREQLALAIGGNPALGLIFGPAHDLATVDGFTAWRGLALGGFLVALGAIFTVVRASRGQEDSGQAELLASGVMARATRLVVAVAEACLGSLAAGVVAAVVTALCGAGWGVSLLLGATFTASGWMFAAIAAVAAQLGADARTSASLAAGALGVLFGLRGFLTSLDAPEWTIWANPLGWMQKTRPAAGDHWWPLLLAVALTAVGLAVAFLLQARRDFGQGAISPRPGPARGRMRGIRALVVRLNRGSMLVWFIAFLALGVVFGYLGTSIDSLFASDSAISRVLAAGAANKQMLISAFLVTILSLIGIVAAVPGVQTLLKARGEELDDRLEPVIAAAVSRPRYLAVTTVTALASSTVYVLAAGITLAAVASGSDIGEGFGDMVLQAVATVPAVWTVVAFSVLIVGARPVVSIAAWLGVLASFVLTLLGPTFRFPDWALGISPFWHVPNVTADAPDWFGLLWVSLVTAILLAIGLIGFRRRDLARQ